MPNRREAGTATSSMMTGSFRDRESAERAYQSLIRKGYTPDEINVLMSDETRRTHFSDDASKATGVGSKASEGAVAGAAIGGTAGAIVGVITAAGALALPGLGLVIAGPIAAGLAGLGAGGAAGGLVGALVGAGIPEDVSKKYETDIKDGAIVVGVTPRHDMDAQYFDQEWRSLRGRNIYR